MCTNNYLNKEIFDKVITKIKWCSFFASQCIYAELMTNFELSTYSGT